MPLSSIAAAAIAAASSPRSTISDQRLDRLWRAGAGERLAELEQHRGPVAGSGRLVERAGEQGRRAGRVAQRQRVAGGVSQQRHRLGVGRRLGVHDVSRDLAGGRAALAQDPRGGVMQPLALGGRQVAVDRRSAGSGG